MTTDKRLFIKAYDHPEEFVQDCNFTDSGIWNVAAGAVNISSGVFCRQQQQVSTAVQNAASQPIHLYEGTYSLNFRIMNGYGGMQPTGQPTVMVLDSNNVVVAQQMHTVVGKKFLTFAITAEGTYTIRIDLADGSGLFIGQCTLGVGQMSLKCLSHTDYEIDIDQMGDVEFEFGQEVDEDPTEKKSDFTLDFEIPATNNNNRILGHLFDPSSEGAFSINLPAYFRYGNANVSGGFLNIEKTTSDNGFHTYTGTFYSNLAYIFDRLKDIHFYDNENVTDDLDFSQYSYNRIHTKNVYDCLYKRLTYGAADPIPAATETIDGYTFNYSGKPAYGKGRGSAAGFIDTAGKYEVTYDGSGTADGAGRPIEEFINTSGTVDYLYAAEVFRQIFENQGIGLMSDWVDGVWVPQTQLGNPIPQCDFTNVVVPNAKDTNFMMEKEKSNWWEWYGFKATGDVNSTSFPQVDIIQEVYGQNFIEYNWYWTNVWPNDPFAYKDQNFETLNGWGSEQGSHVNYSMPLGRYYMNDIIGEFYSSNTQNYNNPLRINAHIKLKFDTRLLLRLNNANEKVYKTLLPEGANIIGPQIRLRLVSSAAGGLDQQSIYTGQWQFVCNSVTDDVLEDDFKIARLDGVQNYALLLRNVDESVDIEENCNVSIPYFNNQQHEYLFWVVDIGFRYADAHPNDIYWGYWGLQTHDFDDKQHIAADFYVTPKGGEFSFDIDYDWLANTVFDPTRCLPKDMTQEEWVKNVFKMYNLYMEDLGNDTVRVEPYAKTYSETINGVQNVDYYDITDKVSQEDIQLTRENDLSNSEISFKYEAEDSDLLTNYNESNKLNKIEYAEWRHTYGTGEDDAGTEIGFTPVISTQLCRTYLGSWRYNVKDFVVPHRYSGADWDEDKKTKTWSLKIDDKFEQGETLLYTDRISPLDYNVSAFKPAVFNVFDGSVVYVDYGETLNYIGMYNNPYDANTTLEFGEPNWYYANMIDSPWWNMYRIFYQDKVNLMTDVSFKMMKCYVLLKPIDIYRYRISNVYFIRDNKFRLTKIEGWNGDDLCECTFIKL